QGLIELVRRAGNLRQLEMDSGPLRCSASPELGQQSVQETLRLVKALTQSQCLGELQAELPIGRVEAKSGLQQGSRSRYVIESPPTNTRRAGQVARSSRVVRSIRDA